MLIVRAHLTSPLRAEDCCFKCKSPATLLTTTKARVCFPLRTVAFRENGFSFDAQDVLVQALRQFFSLGRGFAVPRRRALNLPCPAKGYVDIVRKERL